MGLETLPWCATFIIGGKNSGNDPCPRYKIKMIIDPKSILTQNDPKLILIQNYSKFPKIKAGEVQ